MAKYSWLTLDVTSEFACCWSKTVKFVWVWRTMLQVTQHLMTALQRASNDKCSSMNANTKGRYGCEGDQDVTSESCLIFEHLASYSLSDIWYFRVSNPQISINVGFYKLLINQFKILFWSNTLFSSPSPTLFSKCSKPSQMSQPISCDDITRSPNPDSTLQSREHRN